MIGAPASAAASSTGHAHHSRQQQRVPQPRRDARSPVVVPPAPDLPRRAAPAAPPPAVRVRVRVHHHVVRVARAFRRVKNHRVCFFFAKGTRGF